MRVCVWVGVVDSRSHKAAHAAQQQETRPDRPRRLCAVHAFIVAGKRRGEGEKNALVIHLYGGGAHCEKEGGNIHGEPSASEAFVRGVAQSVGRALVW